MQISRQEFSERLAALMKTALFTEGASASGDMLLEIILRSGMQAADSTAASLFFADTTVQRTRTVAYVYDETFYRLDTQTELPASIAWVLRQNVPLRLNRPDTESRFTSSGMDGTPYSAAGFIAVPIRSKDTCFGVLEAAGKKGGGDFSETDVSLLEFIAGYAATVYRTSCAYRLYTDSVKYLEGSTDYISEQELFIAASRIMQEKLALCKRLASSDVPVMIVGENGTGKTLIAKQLHIYGCRATHPFIRVNCAEPSQELLENRLFGRTTSSGNDESCFDRADGGTVFLDEAAAIPLSIQRKLLNQLLQIERNGKNIRLIASTACDLEHLIRDGGFLSELYGKLNVLPLYIPPLRQRKEDITALSRFFLQKYARKVRKNITGFSHDAETVLESNAWRGNVRELKNTVEYGCLNALEPLVSAGDLFPQHTVTALTEEFGDLKSATEAFKRMYIHAVLRKTGGNQTAAASILDIQRTYLSRLMKELKINNPGAERRSMLFS